MAREYDGVRVDHPHGLVCPWVYDRGAGDPLVAVARGARLFESPDLPDHPGLARYAIARPEQIDRAAPRHDDRWVRSLDADQIDRYAERFGILVQELADVGASDIVCEVLSTAPYPLVEVLRRYGLGRFRVTQKADLGESSRWLPQRECRTTRLDHGRHPRHRPSRARRRRLVLYRRGRSSRRIPRRKARSGRKAEAYIRAGHRAGPGSAAARPVCGSLRQPCASRDGLHVRLLRASETSTTAREPSTATTGPCASPPTSRTQYRSNLAAGTAMDVPGAMATALRARKETARPRATILPRARTCRRSSSCCAGTICS